MLSLCQSLTIAEGPSGSLRVFSFVFAEGSSGSWNRTCFYLSDPQRLSLSGSLTVFADLLVLFSFDLSRSFTVFPKTVRPTKIHEDYMETRLQKLRPQIGYKRISGHVRSRYLQSQKNSVTVQNTL